MSLGETIQGTEPFNSIMIGNAYGIPIGSRVMNATNDEAGNDLMPGLLVYRTGGGSIFNAMSFCDALHGMVTTIYGSQIYVVEIEASTKYLNGNFIKTAYADGDPIRVVELKPGDRFWAKGSIITAAVGETLICDNSGILQNLADATPGTITHYSVHGFRCLKTVTAGTWVPVEYLGMISVDDTND